MALYAIGDLHLCLGSPKPMDIFGGAWIGYMDKLKEGMSIIKPEDTTVLLGDLSWALGLDEATRDFAWINEIPGKKIILKGNHDYWWNTATKFYKFCDEHAFSDMFILNNNHYTYGDWAICGTRGWFYEEDRSGEHDEKVFKRELLRLETSLSSAGDLQKIVFLHYPPIYQGYQCPEILELFRKYNVEQCIYGHIHDKGCAYAYKGMYENTYYRLVSADHVYFIPQKIMD